MDLKCSIVVKILIVSFLFVSFSTAQDVQTTTCQNITCAANQVCQMVQVQCIRAPCYPVPQCVEACRPLTGCNLKCSNGWVKDSNGCSTCHCRVCDPDPCPGLICLYGKMKDSDGCVLCPCYQPCMEVSCPSGTQCQTKKDSTTNTFHGECVSIAPQPICTPVTCTNTCRMGYKSDSNGCRTCDCYDPCQGYNCPAGQHCVLTADDCPPGDECRDAPMPYCTASVPSTSKAPESIGDSTCRPLTDCSLSCSNGWMKDSRGCSICQCKVCDPDPCAGIMCLYGRLRDSDGCILCGCNQPCMFANCSANQDCQVVQNAKGNYEGICVARVTRPPCPAVRCGNSCPYTYKSDSNGCQTCVCNDPCESHYCPPDQKCVMSANDCPPGAECRDAPMPYCTDIGVLPGSSSSSSSFKATSATTFSPPSTQRAGRGDSSLTQCCIESGINEACLPYCITNSTELYRNYESLTGCFQYLGSYLHCASGGRSFSNCCRSRGISESCVDLCSGDDQVDMSNQHQTTQCITTSYEIVLTCFNSGIPDVNMTLTTSSTTMSTSSMNVCLEAPDHGPCDESLDRWYYSATSRACALFRYGGCGGNGNNFATKDVCLSRCGTGSICPDVMCEPHCQIVIDQFGCHTCSCSTDCMTQGCPGNQKCTMMPGSCANGTNCALVPRCVSPPGGFCEDLNCTLSCQHGWMTDSNGCAMCQCKTCIPCPNNLTCLYGRAMGSDGCDTCECYQPCQGVVCATGVCQAVRDSSTGIYMGRCYDATSSPPMQRPAFCSLTPDYGLSCRGNVTHWYFDAGSRLCKTFQYGGCLGNDNNFPSRETCQSVCVEESATCQPLTCDPLPLCDYGLKTNERGCLTCQCVDPCEGIVCPTGQTCISQRCTDTQMCREPYTRQCINSTATTTTTTMAGTTFGVCSNVMCQIYCPDGFVKDSKGCPICQCYDPCKNCSTSQTCVRMHADCPLPPAPCLYSVIGSCVDPVTLSTTTPSSTSLSTASTTKVRCLLCARRCIYGMLNDKDSNGCSLCNCHDPCKNLTCTGNTVCLVSEMCQPTQDCTPEVRFKGQCGPPTTVSTPTTSNSVGRTTPKPCIVCGLGCPYGLEMGPNGCPLCSCKQPCKNVTCSGGEVCQPVAVSNGDFIGQCVVPSTTRSPSTTQFRCPQCTQQCRYGMLTDSRGCPTCTCYDPCQNITCPRNAACIVNEMCRPDENCTADARYKWMCPAADPNFNTTTTLSSTAAAKTTPYPCPLASECELACPYNYGRDLKGCRTCQCRNPCQTTACDSSQTCVLVPAGKNCLPDACWPTYTGVCKDANSCQALSNCDLNCAYGFAVNASGCNVCQCRDPCKDVSCSKGFECHIKKVQDCLNGNCQDVPTGYCAVACPSMSTCSISCQYGLARDLTTGCRLCQCHDPCQGLGCSGSESCVIAAVIYGESPSESEFIYQGKCAISSTGTTSTATTSRPPWQCAMPLCLGPPCLFGLSRDENGCMNCNCASSPCQNVTCANANEYCQAVLFCPFRNCLPSSKAVCIVRTRPCEALQMEYQNAFRDNLGNMPQLNCDSDGQFKPTQCYGQDCWCVDNLGNAVSNRSDQSINCYNGSPILAETVRIYADYNVIKPEDGWKFKQQLSQQMANMLSVDESRVTIMQYVKGSIIADVSIVPDPSRTSDEIQQKVDELKPTVFDIRYENTTYESRFDSGATAASTQFPPPSSTDFPPVTDFSSPAAPPSDPPSAGGSNWGDESQQKLMIILICVFVPIAFIAIIATVWLACKTSRHQPMIPPKPLKSGFSTEVTSLESGSEKSYPSSVCKKDYPETHDTDA